MIMVRMRLQGLHQIAQLLALGVQTGGVCPFGRVAQRQQGNGNQTLHFGEGSQQLLRLKHTHIKAFQGVNPSKGISQTTLNLISVHLEQRGEYETAQEIANGTGLAYQTTYRYLQYMAQENVVEIYNIYGKVGRPKQLYRKLLRGKTP